METFKVILYLVIVFGMTIAASRYSKSEKLYAAIMMFCWIVIAFCMDSNDILNYRNSYDYMLLRKKEPLFDALQLGFATAGIPFEVFKILYGTVISILLYRGIKQYTEHSAFAAALFVIGPMTAFSTQMRNSMAGAIIVCAVAILLRESEKDKIRNMLLYTGCVFLAAMFHSSAILFLVFLIPKVIQLSVKDTRRIIYVLVVALLLVIKVFSGVISDLLFWIQSFMGSSAVQMFVLRASQYFAGGYNPNIKGFLYCTFFHVVFYVLTEWACMELLRPKQKKNGFFTPYAVTYIQKLNLLMLLVIPCYAISMQFDRFFNYFVIICYGVILQGVGVARLRKENRGTEKLVMLIMLSCMTFGFIFANIWKGYAEFSRIVNGIFL